MKQFLAVVALALTATQVSPPVLAQGSYASKPVRLIIPFPPGGSNDVVGRMFGQQLGDRLGQSVVIENRGGAGGTIGTDAAAKSAADGYTLLLVSIAYSFSPAMYKSLPYDPAKAFTPVAPIGAGPAVLVVHPGVPIKTAKELVSFAQAKPGALRIASAGIGSFQHLAGELFRLQGKAEMLHIPYKGGGPAMTDVLGGHAEVMMGSLIQTIQHIRTGKLRALGVTGVKRNPALPEIPTIAEAALPEYDATNWWGVVAPSGTPQAIISKLHGEITAIVSSAETKKRLESEGAEALLMSSADFGRFIQAETAKWSRVVVEAGMKGE
ncbi:MAG: tripartite tricarboxylate transporter substrate binding protein [Burkholderiales bacterium]